MANRSLKIIPLIGVEMTKISERKLPTNRDVLSLLFYKKSSKKSIHHSAQDVIVEVNDIWCRSGIEIIKNYNSVAKLEKLFSEWKNIRKSSSRKNSATQKKLEKTFTAKLDELFDIARKNSENLLSEERQNFLSNQRKKNGRVFLLSHLDQSRTESKLDEEYALSQSLSYCSLSEYCVSQSFMISQPESSSRIEDELENHVSRKRKIDVITPAVVAALDRTNTTDRNAVHIISSVVSAMGLSVTDVTLSASLIHKKRIKFRESFATNLQNNFQADQCLILHWDGKQLVDPKSSKKIEWLPVVASGKNFEQLLGVAKLESGSGKNQATAILGILNKWNLIDHIKALSFDTTSVNTGRLNGACSILEEQLKKKLLNFACRHHVYELILRSVVEVSWPATTGPNVPIFKRFYENWDNIDKTLFEIGIEDKLVADALNDEKSEILDFIFSQFEEFQPRDDYKEFLELACIFLGGTPPRGFKFSKPGAMHHARWLSKAIYCLKIFTFKNQFKIKIQEVNNLRQICIFIVKIYLKIWFTAPCAIKAPYQDLKLLQNLVKYQNINVKISKAASEKFAKHLWYLSENLAALSFFDNAIPLETKLKMVKSIKERKSTTSSPKRLILNGADLASITEKSINDLITEKSMILFETYGLAPDFLHIHPEQWKFDESYKNCSEIFQNIKVANDVAERAVALMEQYSSCLTKDDDQKQYLLQVVQHHRKQYPTCNKQNYNH